MQESFSEFRKKLSGESPADSFTEFRQLQIEREEAKKRAVETKARIQQSQQILEQQPGILEETLRGAGKQYAKEATGIAEAVRATGQGLGGFIAGSARYPWERIVKGKSKEEAKELSAKTAESIAYTPKTPKGIEATQAVMQPFEKVVTPIIQNAAKRTEKVFGIAEEDAEAIINIGILVYPSVKGVIKGRPITMQDMVDTARKMGLEEQKVAVLEKLPGDVAVNRVWNKEIREPSFHNYREMQVSKPEIPKPKEILAKILEEEPVTKIEPKPTPKPTAEPTTPIAPEPTPKVEPAIPELGVPSKPTVKPEYGAELPRTWKEAAEPTLEEFTNKIYQESIEAQSQARQKGFFKFWEPKDKPLITNKEVAKAIDKTVLPRHAKAKLKSKLANAKEGMQKWMVYEHTLKDQPVFKNDIRKFQDTPFDAMAESQKKLIGIVGEMNPTSEFPVFEKLVALKSLENEIRAGHKVPGDLSLLEVQGAIAELESKSTPSIQRAIEKHKTLTRLEGEELVSRGKMDPESIKDFYFPHHIIDYTPSWTYNPSLPRRFSKPFRAYLTQRKGTARDIDFDYISAMTDHFQKVYIDNALEDFMVHSVKKFDALPKMSKEQRTQMFGKNGQPNHRGLYDVNGKEYVGFQFEKGNAFYPAKTINEALWQRAVDEGWTFAEFLESEGPRGGQPISEGLAMGKKHQVSLLPKSIAERLEQFRTPMGELPLVHEIMNATAMWKRITLDFAGIPFQINNFMGDAINLYKTDPGAFEKILDAAHLVGKQLYAPKRLTASEQAFLKLLNEQRVTTTHFFRELGVNVSDIAVLEKYQSHNPFNILGTILRQYEKGSVGREEILRSAKFMKDMERIAEGKQVVAGEVDIQGLKPIDAAGKVSREFTVDYGAVTGPYRRFLRGFLTPFMTFYDFNMRNWVKYVAKKPASFAGKTLLPMAAMWTWNNTGDRKRIEERLGYWQYLPHVITGYQTKEGKDIIVSFQTPVDMAGSWFGLDRLPSKITDIRNGKSTIREAALQQLKDTGLGTPRTVVRLLNPMIQVIAGLAMNKDPYTGTTITPERFKGTPEEKKHIANFVMSNLLTPYGQYLRLHYDAEAISKHGKIGALLFKGPLDILRAAGIRKVDLDLREMSLGYEAKQELSGHVKTKLALLEKAYIKASLLGPEGMAQWEEKSQQILARPGPSPTAEQIVNRLYDTRTQIEITNQLIQRTKDPEQRKQLQEQLKLLKQYRYTESMVKKSLKAIRPELEEKLKEIAK